jgi:CRP-like cAMP-binding protein
VAIQAAVRGWRSRRHAAATRTPTRWLLCRGGPDSRQYFFNEMTLVSTYTPPPVLEKYLEAGADGVSRLRRAADEPGVEISPPGMLAPGRRPQWAQADNGFAGVDRPRPSLEPRRAPCAYVKPLPDHVVEAAPQESATLPPPRWQPHQLPEFAILKGSKAAAAAQPKIDIKAEVLRAKVLPAIGKALIPAALGSHQMGDHGKPPSAHTPLAKLAATLAEATPVDGDWNSRWSSLSSVGDVLPQDPVGVLYDQLRPALAAALSQDAAVTSEAEGGGIAAVLRELNGWVSDKPGLGARIGMSTSAIGQQRGLGARAGAGGGLVADPRVEPEPEPEPEPGPEPEPVMTIEEIISGMAVFKPVRQQQRAAIIKWLVRKSFRSGELICREGDLSNDFYIVQSGEVRAVKSRGTTKEVLLKTFRAGEYFGELALLTNAPRAAACVASAPKGGRVEVLQLSRSDLDRSLGPFKDTVKAQMLARAETYSSTGEKTSVTQAEEQRASQRKKELRRTFDEIDTDGSGAIDQDELRVMLTKLGKSSTDAMLERAMSVMDPDGDGLVTFDEFTRFWGEDGSGVDRLAKLEATIGGMRLVRPKDGASTNTAMTENGDEDDSDGGWSDDG